MKLKYNSIFYFNLKFEIQSFMNEIELIWLIILNNWQGQLIIYFFVLLKMDNKIE